VSLVEYRVLDPVALITLARPPVNALNAALTTDLAAAVEGARDPSIRAVVLTGEPHFAAGADITEFRDAFDGGDVRSIVARLSGTIRALERLPKPVIAAVRGFALGGGLEVALGCDFRFLADDAKVGLPEITLGIIPGAGGTQRLPRLIGVPQAREMIYTGRFVAAEEALALGLADRVVAADELLDEALGYARQLAEGPTVALGAARRAINDGWGMNIDDALAVELDEFVRAFGTEDAREGTGAFLEKRRPAFKGS
jgi:enoyl-CoA hydratase